MRRIVAIADDLSGAAETAIALAPTAARGAQDVPAAARIVLLSGIARLAPVSSHRFLVIDTDNRRFPVEDSTRRLESLLQHVLDGERSAATPLVFLKVDSLLRGHLAASIGALAAHGPVVFAPALPALDRSTIDGVVHAEGTPLHQTTLWHAENTAVPSTIAAALAPLRTALVDLGAVRGPQTALDDRLRELASAGTIAVCDAETADDLDAVAAAALRQVGTHLVGASAFGAALGRAAERMLTLRPPQHPLSRNSPSRNSPSRVAGISVSDPGTSVLVVVGTASSQSREQLRTLADEGVTLITLRPVDLLNGTADSTALRTALEQGSAAVCVDQQTIDPAVSGRLAEALAEFVAPVTTGRHLVLTGGATARAVLDSMGVRWMDPVHEIEHGAVLSRTDQGTLVVTRPGSFGAPRSLHGIHQHLLALPLAPPHSTPSAAVRPAPISGAS